MAEMDANLAKTFKGQSGPWNSVFRVSELCLWRFHRTPWRRVWSTARSIATKDKTNWENEHTATIRNGFEPMIPLLERYQRAGVSEHALSNSSRTNTKFCPFQSVYFAPVTSVRARNLSARAFCVLRIGSVQAGIKMSQKCDPQSHKYNLNLSVPNS
jgi:hypothetical protein